MTKSLTLFSHDPLSTLDRVKTLDHPLLLEVLAEMNLSGSVGSC